VVVTATTEHEQSLAEIGAAAYLLKPFNVEELLLTLARVHREHALTGAAASQKSQG
jgi:DNA-binding response OmpR family regulator